MTEGKNCSVPVQQSFRSISTGVNLLYSQDVGDDSYAPKKQKTFIAGVLHDQSSSQRAEYTKGNSSCNRGRRAIVALNNC